MGLITYRENEKKFSLIDLPKTEGSHCIEVISYSRNIRSLQDRLSYKYISEDIMIPHTKTMAVIATLLCLGLSLVVIDSFSTTKFMSRRPNWKRSTESRQCPSSKYYNNNMQKESRLYGVSDFSSHPYSVYYGTSGSTAKQNFGQNDQFNDVYGYGPDEVESEEYFDSHHPNSDRSLQSMQAIPLFDGRRGATVFGSRKYHGGGRDFYRDPRMPHEHEMMHPEDRMMGDQHMMHHMDSLMHERDHLRRRLDDVYNENKFLHNQNQFNGAGPQNTPPQGQEQYFPSPEQSLSQQNPATSSAVANVMDELKNMRQTVQAFEAQHHQRNVNGVENSEAEDEPVTTPSVEEMKSELKEMEKVLDSLERENGQSSDFANGYDASGGEASQGEPTSFNGEPTSFNGDGVASMGVESTIASSTITDGGHSLFDGEYEVVIKAQLKKKSVSQPSVEKQIDVNNGSTRESPLENNYR